MKRTLSILIPTYNDKCLNLVKELKGQADKINGLEYEIIVADDGSTDPDVIKDNSQIALLGCCKFIRNIQNLGRAKIRNFLASMSAFEWLLFIDGDMLCIHPQFIINYLNINDDYKVVYGGYDLLPTRAGNLRWKYELKAQPFHHAAERNKHAWNDFHTSNFLIASAVFRQYPLDERFTHYGYEDVLYGKCLKANGIRIWHIDNPVTFAKFENNTSFVKKTEESLCTLYHFHTELGSYSRIVSLCSKLHSMHLTPLVKAFHHAFGTILRRNLCGMRPSLLCFNVYKIGYYVCLQ